MQKYKNLRDKWIKMAIKFRKLGDKEKEKACINEAEYFNKLFYSLK